MLRGQVHLVGHSAGGWLGRAFIADPLYFDSPPSDKGLLFASPLLASRRSKLWRKSGTPLLSTALHANQCVEKRASRKSSSG